MPAEERVDRATLLRRAVAAAGAAYVAPTVTSSAAEVAVRCSGQPCRSGKKGVKKCRKMGGAGCRCVDGRCKGGDPFECGEACNGGLPCDVLFTCGERDECFCFIIDGADPYPVHACSAPINLCNEVGECERGGGGEECPAGSCCMDTCCPTGICAYPCGWSSFAQPRRRGGSGPRPYR